MQFNSEDKIDVVSCPHCLEVLDKQFLTENTSRAFINEVLRGKRKGFLFREQLSLRNVTTPFINCLKRKRNILRDIDSCVLIISEQRAKIRKLESKLDDENALYYGRLPVAPKTQERLCIDKSCNGVLCLLNEPLELVEAEDQMGGLGDLEQLGDPEQREDLEQRGDLEQRDKTMLICGSCEMMVCPRCFLSAAVGHECREEDLKSLRAIEDNCKPCPSCGVRIALLQGCSQMFCTQCNCAFDWRTLQIVRSGQYFHNPHYAAFREMNGGGAGNELWDNNFFHEFAWEPEEIAFADINKKTVEETGFEETATYMKGFLYYANELLDRYGTSKTALNELRQRHNRVLFMLNEISEEQFKCFLFKSDRLNEFSDSVAEEARQYASFTRATLARWAKANEISRHEAVTLINERFATTQASVLSIEAFYARRNRHPFLTNNYVVN